MSDQTPRSRQRQRLALGGVLMLLVGAGAGAGATALTRPSIDLPPAAPTAIAQLANSRGIVMVQGTTEGIFGDRLLVHDATGRTLIDVGPRAGASARIGAPIKAQGRFADGQLHARYLIGPDGAVEEAGPPPPPPHGPGGPPHGPHDLAMAPPPPPPTCGPAPVAANGAVPATPPASAAAPA